MLAKAALIFLLSNNTMGLSQSIDVEEAYCLALNIYHESRSESVPGQVAVATTTLNRVYSRAYPNTICEVVNQSKQFSWVGDEFSDIAHEKQAFHQAAKIALMAMSGMIGDNTHGATHYHNQSVSPKWASVFLETVTYGAHTFYKPEDRKI